MTLEERIKQLEEMNAQLEKRLADKYNRIAYLEQLYGSRSEKRLPINPDALQLSLFSAEIDVQEQQRLDAAIAKDEERREMLLKVDGYERKVRKVEPLITESLVLVPQKMYIRRIVRHKYVLKTSLQQADPERQVFEIAALPPAPIHKCMTSESVLADILVQKFVYQSDILSCPYIQVDESTIPVIDNENSKTRKGYMWCVRDASGAGVSFHYDMVLAELRWRVASQGLPWRHSE